MNKLKELLDYIQPTKYIVSSDQYSDEYSIPVLTAGDTFLLGFTNDDDGIYPASRNNPIILFDDFTTAIKWVDFPFKVKSSACKILVPKNGANLKYCYYAMQALDFDHTLHKRYWISEYSEQSINDYGQKNQLIVNELDTINNLIVLKKKRLADFDEIIKSRFIEMFGTPIENNKKWNIKKAVDICKVVTDGSHFSPKGCENGTIPMLSVKDMRSNGFCYDECKMIDELEYAIMERQGCVPQIGDVLVAKDGSYFTRAFAIGEFKKQAILSSIGIYRPNQKIVLPRFLADYLMSENVIDFVNNGYVTGSALKRVIIKGLKEIPVYVPPIHLQQDYINFANQIDKSKFILQKQIELLNELLGKKMNEYFG